MKEKITAASYKKQFINSCLQVILSEISSDHVLFAFMICVWKMTYCLCTILNKLFFFCHISLRTVKLCLLPALLYQQYSQSADHWKHTDKTTDMPSLHRMSTLKTQILVRMFITCFIISDLNCYYCQIHYEKKSYQSDKTWVYVTLSVPETVIC